MSSLYSVQHILSSKHRPQKKKKSQGNVRQRKTKRLSFLPHTCIHTDKKHTLYRTRTDSELTEYDERWRLAGPLHSFNDKRMWSEERCILQCIYTDTLKRKKNLKRGARTHPNKLRMIREITFGRVLWNGQTPFSSHLAPRYTQKGSRWYEVLTLHEIYVTCYEKHCECNSPSYGNKPEAIPPPLHSKAFVQLNS